MYLYCRLVKYSRTKAIYVLQPRPRLRVVTARVAALTRAFSSLTAFCSCVSQGVGCCSWAFFLARYALSLFFSLFLVQLAAILTYHKSIHTYEFDFFKFAVHAPSPYVLTKDSQVESNTSD